MRRILCAECGIDRNIQSGSDVQSDGMYSRVTWGKAREPQPEQREITLISEGETTVTPLPPEYYNCDSCNAEIKPGDRCCAQTVWKDTAGMGFWEKEFLEEEQVQPNQ